MRWTLEQVRTFDTILRLGSFHAAARHLGLTQPTVSQRVRELETAIGSPLFIRRGPRTMPNARAHELLTHARRLLAAAEDMAASLGTPRPLRGTLRLGATDSFAQLCIAELMTRLERSYPELKLSVCVDDSASLGRQLQAREIDIAVISEPTLPATIRQEVIGWNVMAWVASRSMRLPRGKLDAAALAQQHLVLNAPPSRLHGTVMRWFAEEGVSPSRVSTCNNLSVMIRLALGGRGIGIVPLAIVREEIAGRALRLVSTVRPPPTHRVCLCYHVRDETSDLGRLAALIREVVADRSPFAQQDR